MEYQKGLKHLKSSVLVIGSLQIIFQTFEIRILFADAILCFQVVYICTRNASIRAPTQNIPVGSPVALIFVVVDANALMNVKACAVRRAVTSAICSIARPPCASIHIITRRP